MPPINQGASHLPENNISYTDARKIFSSQDMSTDKTMASPLSTSTASASALLYLCFLSAHLSRVSQAITDLVTLLGVSQSFVPTLFLPRL